MRGFLRTTWRWSWRLIGLAVLAFILLQCWFLGCIVWWSSVNPDSSSFMRAEADRLAKLQPPVTLRQQWVGYGKISNHLKRAVIASEDGKFNEHEGVDWEAIEKAYEHNRKLEEAREKALAKGRKPPSKPVRGGSTITQQLAKNLFLSGERSYLRKGQEVIITYMLEAVLSKQRILEMYLNLAEWGEGVFGAEAAARHYFGVSAAQLSPAQAARLAAMLPRPRYFDKHRGSGYLAGRSGTILARMAGVDIP